jgi:hypothetical protein
MRAVRADGSDNDRGETASHGHNHAERAIYRPVIVLTVWLLPSVRFMLSQSWAKSRPINQPIRHSH